MQLFSLENYDKEIAPFLRNGVLIDTSTLWEFIQGLTRIRRRTVNTGWGEEYQKIVNLFERIRINNIVGIKVEGINILATDINGNIYHIPNTFIIL